MVEFSVDFRSDSLEATMIRQSGISSTRSRREACPFEIHSSGFELGS